MLVATNARGIVQIVPLPDCTSTQIWTTASGIIGAFLNRPFNVIVLTPTNYQPYLSKKQRISMAFSFVSDDETSPNISNPLICEGNGLGHHQPHIVILQQMVNHKQGTQGHEVGLARDWQYEIITPNKYKTQTNAGLQLLSLFEDESDEHFGRIKTVRRIVELTSSDIRPVDFIP